MKPSQKISLYLLVVMILGGMLLYSQGNSIELQPREKSTSVAGVKQDMDQIDGIANYRKIADNIAVGGLVTKQAVHALKEQNYSTIIDLREPEEGIEPERILVEDLGMEYINIPVGAAGITDALLAKFTTAFEAVKEGNILIHCVSSNRVGGMWTRYQLSKGVASDVAFKEGRDAGMRSRIEAMVRMQCSC